MNIFLKRTRDYNLIVAKHGRRILENSYTVKSEFSLVILSAMVANLVISNIVSRIFADRRGLLEFGFYLNMLN